MPNVRMLTYGDLVDHALDYLGATTSEESERYARRASQSAYKELCRMRPWSIHYSRMRVTTNASQTDGTIAYDHTGGAYERMVTLTGSTWPDWARYGFLRVGNVSYEIAEVKSSTVLTLTYGTNPGADVASGTAYTLLRDTYPLPGDFMSMDELINIGFTTPLSFKHPRDWLTYQRLSYGPAVPTIYCVSGDPNYIGSLSLRLFPAPDAAYQLDAIYRRQARQINIASYKTGVASCTNGTTTVTGSGTSWNDTMVNTVIRFSANSTYHPTGVSGSNPNQVERTVLSVESATSLTIDADPGESLSGVKYTISDPIDIEDTAMTELLLREVEKQVRIIRRLKPTEEELMEYKAAMFRAFETDSRSFGSRRAMGNGTFLPRMADMPFDSGV